jgi:hypothetical protein
LQTTLRVNLKLVEEKSVIEGVQNMGISLDLTKDKCIAKNGEYEEVLLLGREHFTKIFNAFKEPVSKIHGKHF